EPAAPLQSVRAGRSRYRRLNPEPDGVEDRLPLLLKRGLHEWAARNREPAVAADEPDCTARKIRTHDLAARHNHRVKDSLFLPQRNVASANISADRPDDLGRGFRNF